MGDVLDEADIGVNSMREIWALPNSEHLLEI